MRHQSMHPKSPSQSSPSPPPYQSPPARLFVYLLVLLYLVTDLFWIGGPLRSWVDNRRPDSETSRQRALERGWVASVNGVPIVKDDIDRVIARRMALTGQAMADLTPRARRLERRIALDQVLRQRLLLTYSSLNPVDEPDDQTAIQTEIELWQKRLEHAESEVDPTSSQFADLICTEQRIARWIATRIEPASNVGEDEIRTWLAEHPSVGQVPERYRVRHLYLSRHRESGANRQDDLKRVGEALSDVAAADWDRIVEQWSEDPATAAEGGRLGWISLARMPGDFMEAVERAALRLGQVTGPHATGLGWHWIVVDEVAPARRATLGELREEVRAHLENRRRAEGVERLMTRARERAKILIYDEFSAEQEPGE